MYSTESHSFRGVIQVISTDARILAVALVIGIAFATWAGWRIWRDSDDVRLRWSALTLAMLFSSPHLLTYDLLLLAVPLVLVGDWRCQPDLKVRPTYDFRGEHVTAWRVAMVFLYIGAWPGTLLARMYTCSHRPSGWLSSCGSYASICDALTLRPRRRPRLP